MQMLSMLCVDTAGMVTIMITRTYKELIRIPSFEERFQYLKLTGRVGEDTFGFDRYLNQQFYKSIEWRQVRDFVIARDLGCDLGINDREIHGQILVHHMNPIAVKDILDSTDILLNPNYLICCSKLTHNALHYGDVNLLVSSVLTERHKNDTCPWKR